MQNNAGTGVPDWHIIDTTETRFVPVGEPSKENAATSVKVNGVKSNVAVQTPLANNAPKTDGSAISKWAKPIYRKIAKALGLALILGTEWAWHGFTIALLAHLTEHERAALAFAALNGLDEDNAYAAASVILFGTLNGEVMA
jgi:hypothetical protein